MATDASEEKRREALLEKLRELDFDSDGYASHFLSDAEARALLRAHDEAVLEACLKLVHDEETATAAALEHATGAFFEECLVAKKVLRHVAEKIAALRAPKGEKP